MANFQGLELWSGPTNGVLLPLRSAPRTSGRRVLESGVEVEIMKRVRAVAIRNLPAVPSDEALLLAIGHANEALDFLAVGCVAPVVLGDCESFNVVWQSRQGSQRVRILCSYLLQFRASATGAVIGKDGPKEIDAVAEIWHPSLRYFRLSQSTDDLFDAYRNLYLALESLLSSIVSRLEGEGEGRWLKRALKSLDADLDLNLFTQTTSSDAASALYEELWNDMRNRVFHAKTGEESLLPLDQSVRPAVLDSLLRFGMLYLALAEAHLRTRFLSTGLGEGGFRAMVGAFEGLEMIGIEDHNWIDDQDDWDLPAEGKVFSAQMSHAPPLDAPFKYAIRGEFHREDSNEPMQTIGSLAIVKGDKVYFAEDLEGRLNIGDAQIIEVIFVIEAGGVALRASYPS